MYLMKLIADAFSSRKRAIIAFVVNTVIIFTFYFLFFKNSALIYPFMLSAFIFLIYFVIEIYIYKRFRDKLNDSIKSPNYFSKDLDFNEKEIFETIATVHRDYLFKIEKLEREIKGKEKLFSEWVHNMKTAVTVIDLACDKSKISNDSTEYINDIKEENNFLKKNLEECLNVLRLDDFARDYITESCNLKELVTGIINSKKRDFIYKNIFPNVEIEGNIHIYTDMKWCSYMINQIISNSIKYSDKGKVEIFASETEEMVLLEIKDSGVGIESHELPRVFEPFFTGQNGRNNREATGIGLYMVKNIADKLTHEISIDSELGIGTSVKITFKKPDNIQF